MADIDNDLPDFGFEQPPLPRKADEERLWIAHRNHAMMSGESAFPIKIELVVGGVGDDHYGYPQVFSTRISTTVDLRLVSKTNEDLSTVSVASMEGPDSPSLAYLVGKDGRCLAAVENFHASYARHYEYVRDLATDWAANAFNAGLASRSPLDRGGIAKLKLDIESGLHRAIGSLTYYVAADARQRLGTFYRTAEGPLHTYFETDLSGERLRVGCRPGDRAADWQTALCSFPATHWRTAAAVRDMLWKEAHGAAYDDFNQDDRIDVDGGDLVRSLSPEETRAEIGLLIAGFEEFADTLAATRGLPSELAGAAAHLKEAARYATSYSGGDEDALLTAIAAARTLDEQLHAHPEATAAFLREEGWTVHDLPTTIARAKANFILGRELDYDLGFGENAANAHSGSGMNP